MMSQWNLVLEFLSLLLYLYFMYFIAAFYYVMYVTLIEFLFILIL